MDELDKLSWALEGLEESQKRQLKERLPAVLGPRHCCAFFQAELAKERHMTALLEEENTYIKRERSKWLGLHQEYQQLTSTLHTVQHSAEQAHVQLNREIQGLREANRALETQLLRMQEDHVNHTNRLANEHYALRSAFEALQQKYEDESSHRVLHGFNLNVPAGGRTARQRSHHSSAHTPQQVAGASPGVSTTD